MIIKDRIKFFAEKYEGQKNDFLVNAIRGWMLWRTCRERCWYFDAAYWIKKLEAD